MVDVCLKALWCVVILGNLGEHWAYLGLWYFYGGLLSWGGHAVPYGYGQEVRHDDRVGQPIRREFKNNLFFQNKI